MIIAFWFSHHPVEDFNCLGGCILEKPEQRAAAPDQVLYIGAGSPRWQPGEPRRVNLRQWRVPDLVCEVGDTTLAADLDEKKQSALVQSAVGRLAERRNIPRWQPSLSIGDDRLRLQLI